MQSTVTTIFPYDKISSATGYCKSCDADHHLPMAPAIPASLELMSHLEDKRSIGLDDLSLADPRFSTDPLFGEARGKMFGILVCATDQGEKLILKAFSGQYNTMWSIPGWAPPLFEEEEFSAAQDEQEKKIKDLTGRLARLTPVSPEYLHVKQQRRSMSRELMQDIFSIYRVYNFQGETRSMAKAFAGTGGIPTGTGDCCGPKLLSQAATLGLRPLGMAEFFWGRTNKSQSRRHGYFYPSCREKCQPLLGYILCGATQET